MPDAVLAILCLSLLIAAAGSLLFILSNNLPEDESALSEEINALLPQTQCGQCQYPGCRPYADAIASGRAEINLCPPGGDACIESLAKLLGRNVLPLDPGLVNSVGQNDTPDIVPIAYIREEECIGCTLCIHACPVDAILGASRMMHTVITAECTGCELCIAPCPVDCIDLLPPTDLLAHSTISTAASVASR